MFPSDVEKTLKKFMKERMIEGFSIESDTITIIVREDSPLSNANYVLFPSSFFKINKIVLKGEVKINS